MALPSDIRDQLTLPVFVAPMFLVSTPALAIASCAAGLIGSLTRNHCRDLAEMKEQLREVSEALVRLADEHPGRRIGPLCVNLSPNWSEAEFRENLEVCKRYGVRIIVTSVGNPTKNAPLVQEYGFLHYHDATTIRFAEKAAAAGVDGIVCIGAGGGGHAGTISHLAFIPKVRAMFDGTVVMAGAISSGAAIRAAEVLGADLAYMGTRFIATTESGAPDAYKRMLVEAGVPDVLYTPAVNGMPASWLVASMIEAGLDLANLPHPPRHSTDHLLPGKTPWRNVWSGGQGVGLIEDLPGVAELASRLQREYLAACAVPDWSDAVRAALAVAA